MLPSFSFFANPPASLRRPLFFMAELVGRSACPPSGPAAACSASSSASVSVPHAGWSQAFCPYAPGPQLPLGRAGSTSSGMSFKCCASWDSNCSSCCGGPGGSKSGMSNHPVELCMLRTEKWVMFSRGCSHIPKVNQTCQDLFLRPVPPIIYDSRLPAFSVWTSLLSLLHAANTVSSPPPFCPWEVNLVYDGSLEGSGILESGSMMEQ